jgi:hypothetical protein
VRFRIVIDATFEAEDIDQALIVAAVHLLDPLIDDLPDGWLGGIDVQPIEETE